jgi:hypothetical protein
MRSLALSIAFSIAVLPAACSSDPTPPLATAPPGVVFTFPADRQLDVPVGTRIVVTFSEPIDATALGPCSGQGDAVTGAFCVVGPDGPIAAEALPTDDGFGVAITNPSLAAGTTYAVYVRAALDPVAENLPASGPLFTFTTRATRPRAAAPAVVSIDGSDPAQLATAPFRPFLDSSTLRLVFSEPLDPRSVELAPGALELLDPGGAAVPALVVSSGIHVSIDPDDLLTAGAAYTLRVGPGLVDLGGQPVAAGAWTLTPLDSQGNGTIPQVLRARQPGDPGPDISRAGLPPNIALIHSALIGDEEKPVLSSTLASVMGDPEALGGPIAFTIPKGQRLHLGGIDVKLGGSIPTGLATGDIVIELLTDAGGRLFRNPYQAGEQRPENARSPLHVDFTLDLALSSVDPIGNAVMTETVLNVQAVGTAIATDGVLAIDTATSMDLSLLGVTTAPTNMVLQLITDTTGAQPDVDAAPPVLVATYPTEGSNQLGAGDGIELIFDEAIDVARARAGGIRLETAGGQAVATTIESHGAAIVVRPRARLAYATNYRVLLGDVVDLAGNRLEHLPVTMATPPLAGTDAPLMVVAAHPGVPCAVTATSAAAGGRCRGGGDGDDLYRPFAIGADEPVGVVFDQPPTPGSLTLGTSCNTGSVRIEELDAGGGCAGAVEGTFVARERSFEFVPDRPWAIDRRYRLTLVSGDNDSCGAGEICGLSGDAGNFDPLEDGAGDPGGANLVIDFAGAPQVAPTFIFHEVSPMTDLNGSGTVDGGETRRDENRAAMRITGTTGAVSEAEFTTDDCLPATPETEACLYLSGAMPVELGALATNCALPDGTTAPTCIPATLSPQAMYGTAVTMSAEVIGLASIDANTETSVMRIREPAAGGPLTGYIVESGGGAELVLALDVYMDAPDMEVLLSSHDLHSKPLTMLLRGPVEFLPDGRIVIGAANVNAIPLVVNIDAPLGITGAVEMVVPAGEMRLQLMSPPLRGGAL